MADAIMNEMIQAFNTAFASQLAKRNSYGDWLRRQRTNHRMQDQWRNEGSGDGNSYLDFLTGMYAR